MARSACFISASASRWLASLGRLFGAVAAVASAVGAFVAEPLAVSGLVAGALPLFIQFVESFTRSSHNFCNCARDARAALVALVLSVSVALVLCAIFICALNSFCTASICDLLFSCWAFTSAGTRSLIAL